MKNSLILLILMACSSSVYAMLPDLGNNYQMLLGDASKLIAAKNFTKAFYILNWISLKDTDPARKAMVNVWLGHVHKERGEHMLSKFHYSLALSQKKVKNLQARASLELGRRAKDKKKLKKAAFYLCQAHHFSSDDVVTIEAGMLLKELDGVSHVPPVLEAKRIAHDYIYDTQEEEPFRKKNRRGDDND